MSKLDILIKFNKNTKNYISSLLIYFNVVVNNKNDIRQVTISAYFSNAFLKSFDRQAVQFLHSFKKCNC